MRGTHFWRYSAYRGPWPLDYPDSIRVNLLSAGLAAFCLQAGMACRWPNHPRELSLPRLHALEDLAEAGLFYLKPEETDDPADHHLILVLELLFQSNPEIEELLCGKLPRFAQTIPHFLVPNIFLQLEMRRSVEPLRAAADQFIANLHIGRELALVSARI